jgi:hypothetical protein
MGSSINYVTVTHFKVPHINFQGNPSTPPNKNLNKIPKHSQNEILTLEPLMRINNIFTTISQILFFNGFIIRVAKLERNFGI